MLALLGLMKPMGWQNVPLADDRNSRQNKSPAQCPPGFCFGLDLF